jgi:tRNA-dihydrouridine synthase
MIMQSANFRTLCARGCASTIRCSSRINASDMSHNSFPVGRAVELNIDLVSVTIRAATPKMMARTASMVEKESER